MRLNLFLSTVMLMVGSANAEPFWVQTPFWQTAYGKSQTAKIKPVDVDLDDVCEEYKAMVYAGPGKSDLEAFVVDSLRTNTDRITELQYSATFIVDRAASESLFAQSLQNVSAAIASTAQHDLLPNYTLAPAKISPLDKILSPLQIRFSADSLSRVSEVLGLRPLKIEVVATNPAIKIRVVGRDSVCDLYRGQAFLLTHSEGQVKVTLEDQLRLSEFYQNLEDQTEAAFKKTESSSGRMAVLGFRLAPAVIAVQSDREKAASLVENLVMGFFDLKGERNDKWIDFNGKPHLSVNGAVSAQFELSLER